MKNFRIARRGLIGGGLALGAAAALPAIGGAAIASPTLPPAIGTAERLARLAKARALMAHHGLGAILVEAGPSLDYFTGVQWWRSERLTAAVIPVSGDPIIVTPFFEKLSVEESLGVPAEVRVWQEDESPHRLVADFLTSKGLARSPVGFEETVRFFAVDGLRAELPKAEIVSANPVVRGCRMIKTPAELALMQSAADIMIAAYRNVGPRIRAGMTPADITAMINSAVSALGGKPEFALVLIGEASAYPHGTGKPQQVAKGDLVLMDCGCSVHGYFSDISRSFVWGAEPTAEQRKVWMQMRRGQDIAFATARVGVPAGQVDDAVRRTYESWGYGPRYKLPGTSHRTGHGIGMEVHEPINLVHGETTPLAPGMCFSNEPGIYLPGKFGVRLEDCFHMTAAGPKWFSVPPPSIDRPFD